MWKNSLKNVESDNNKILYETILDFFLQRISLNKPHKWLSSGCTQESKKVFAVVFNFLLS